MQHNKIICSNKNSAESKYNLSTDRHGTHAQNILYTSIRLRYTLYTESPQNVSLFHFIHRCHMNRLIHAMNSYSTAAATAACLARTNSTSTAQSPRGLAAGLFRQFNVAFWSDCISA